MMPAAAATDAIIDWDRLEQFTRLSPGGSHQLARQWVDLYVQNSTRLLAELRQGMACDDGQRVLRAAHSLKSTSANIGANGLAELARSVEHAAASGHWQLAGSAAAAIAQLHGRVLQALAARFIASGPSIRPLE